MFVHGMCVTVCGVCVCSPLTHVVAKISFLCVSV